MRMSLNMSYTNRCCVLVFHWSGHIVAAALKASITPASKIGIVSIEGTSFPQSILLLILLYLTLHRISIEIDYSGKSPPNRHFRSFPSSLS